MYKCVCVCVCTYIHTIYKYMCIHQCMHPLPQPAFYFSGDAEALYSQEPPPLAAGPAPPTPNAAWARFVFNYKYR